MLHNKPTQHLCNTVNVNCLSGGFGGPSDHYWGNRGHRPSLKCPTCPLWPQLRPRFKIIIPLQLLAWPAQVTDGPEPCRRMVISVTPWTHRHKSQAVTWTRRWLRTKFSRASMIEISRPHQKSRCVIITIYGRYALLETSKPGPIPQENNRSWLGRA